jgi:hypothetical protein
VMLTIESELAKLRALIADPAAHTQSAESA